MFKDSERQMLLRSNDDEERAADASDDEISVRKDAALLCCNESGDAYRIGQLIYSASALCLRHSNNKTHKNEANMYAVSP